MTDRNHGNDGARGTRLDRRRFLRASGGALASWPLAAAAARAGALEGLAGGGPAELLNPLAPRPPHFAPKAKAVIFLFMYGGPSQVDTF
ncbi:MAG: DUF1501 domain-containing protein, partial [Planctomycetota bacterium JB042]